MKPGTPFVYNTPVPPRQFIGRKREVEQILDQLANPARGSSAISGDPRVGKTSLLHYLADEQVRQEWGLGRDWCHFLYLDCHNLVPFSEAAFWRYLLRELERDLGDDEKLSGQVQTLLAQPQPEIYDLSDLFDEIARAGRLAVLMLDEFEGIAENLDPGSPGLLYHLRALLNRPQRGLAILTASRVPLKQLCAGLRFAGSPFDNSFAAVSLPPFSEAEVDELLDRYQAGFSDSERADLHRLAGAQPYLVQLTASLMARAGGTPGGEETTLSQIEAELDREIEGYVADMLAYCSERQQMLLAWLALYHLSQHMPAEQTRLGDLLRLFDRYDREMVRLRKQGLARRGADEPALFSPIFGRWVLRRTIVDGGREILAGWEPYYANFFSAAQKEAFHNLINKVIEWPAIVDNLTLLPQPSLQNKRGQKEQRIGRYVIEKSIGRSSLTDIFRAYDPRLDRLVAIKRLRSDIRDESQERQDRFDREAQAIATLRHPHIVQIYDFDVQDNHRYMVMEFIEGRNLREYLQELHAAGQTLPWEETLRIAGDVADALDYAHQRQMVHRDVKPANILLANNGGVFLADFGLVRLLNQPGLTQTGQLIGALAYMAPEQVRARSEEIDYRADIYGLGCVVYEMITGRPPFAENELPQAHLTTFPPPPDRLVANLPQLASQVIMTALAKDPAERPFSAAQFINDLRQAFEVRDDIHVVGPVPLPEAQRAIIKQLYAESSYPRIGQVHIQQKFHGGLSGAQVILAQPADDHNRGLAREIVKIGPAAMLRREYNRYRQFVKGRLPMTAVSLERGPVEFETLACLSYGFLGDQPSGKVEDLETYYAGHSASEVAEVLTRLMKPLDARWYGPHAPLLASFADEYGQQLPAHLVLQAERLSTGGDFTPGNFQPIDVETVLEASARLEIGERVALRDLQISEAGPDMVKLRNVGDGPAIWVRARLTTPRPDLQEGDRVHVLGIVEARRHDILIAVVANALNQAPALTHLPDGSLQLAGLEQLWPDPLALYPQALKQPLNGRQSIIHGDLHPGNILVDEWDRGWLIDFDHVREGHVLYDFIRLETLLRLFILGEVRRFLGRTDAPPAARSLPTGWPYAFSLAEYAAFETSLMQQFLDQPAQALDRPDLAKAAEVIQAIRRLAQPYLRNANDWSEYLIGLFLHNLAQLKFYQDLPHLAILPFTTAAVLGGEIGRLVIGDWI